MNGISIIVPSYKSQRTIEKCLSSLRKARLNASFPTELIMLDSSPPGYPAPALIPQEHETLLRLFARTLPGKARNICAHKARFDWLAFTDADCEVDSSWLKNAWEVINRRKVNVFSGIVKNGTPGCYWASAAFFLEFSEFLAKENTRKSNFISCNLFIRRQLFDNLNGFPESFWPGEDRVLAQKCFMLLKGKWEIRTNIFVRHLNRLSGRACLQHSKSLGTSSALARRNCPELPMSGLVRLNRFAFPVCFVGRILPLLRRVPSMDSSTKASVFRSLPAIVLLSYCWSKGFVEGINHDIVGKAAQIQVEEGNVSEDIRTDS